MINAISEAERASSCKRELIPVRKQKQRATVCQFPPTFSSLLVPNLPCNPLPTEAKQTEGQIGQRCEKETAEEGLMLSFLQVNLPGYENVLLRYLTMDECHH